MASEIHERFLQMKKEKKDKIISGGSTAIRPPAERGEKGIKINQLVEDPNTKKGAGNCCT